MSNTEDTITVENRTVAVVCIAVVMIACIIACIVFINIEGASQQRETCAEQGGSWIAGGQCLLLTEGTS